MSLKREYETVPSDAQHYFDNYSRDWMLRNTTAHYDPIFTPILTSFFTTAFSFSAATAGVVATGLTAIATTALTRGIMRAK